MPPNKVPFLIILITLLVGCQEKPRNAQGAFFANLGSLCGQRFIGASTFPDDPAHDFAGKTLVADFNDCRDQEIRIQFDVGADRSRTWVITLTDAGLLLKHDHRHADGTPDEITNYGGWANDQVSEWQQYFPADAETAALIPAAATNVWMLRYEPQSATLTYDLKRHGQPRYQAQLQPVNQR
ncbi:hypothetical protein [Marinicella meishanensis]|uniref:hypothetical protein n=1 Tax=Marinicella meishanensis TaxID=2873263 RepID=UPI001CBF683D|nr:hypothetical protein [Marinicella sp. NBU2979]